MKNTHIQKQIHKVLISHTLSSATTSKCLSDGDSPVCEALSVGLEGVRRGGGRWELPMGGRPGWGEGACSAGGEGAGADACAASECFGWVELSPG